MITYLETAITDASNGQIAFFTILNYNILVCSALVWPQFLAVAVLQHQRLQLLLSCKVLYEVNQITDSEILAYI